MDITEDELSSVPKERRAMYVRLINGRSLVGSSPEYKPLSRLVRGNTVGNVTELRSPTICEQIENGDLNYRG